MAAYGKQALQLTNTEWIIIAGVLAVTLGGGLLAVRRSGAPSRMHNDTVAFLWAFAAVYGLILGSGYLSYGRTVIGIHWLLVAAIAGWAAYKKALKGSE